MEKFWEHKTLSQMTHDEWEAVCDGCGLCCLVKLVDADTEELLYTRIVCRLMERGTCRCSDYDNRLEKVSDCVQFTPDTIGDIDWLPESCGYVRLAAGKKLSPWHPLLSGDPKSVHESGISIMDWSVLETEENMADPIDYIIEDPVDLSAPKEN